MILWLLRLLLLLPIIFACSRDVEKGDSFGKLAKMPIFTTTKQMPADVQIQAIELAGPEQQQQEGTEGDQEGGFGPDGRGRPPLHPPFPPPPGVPGLPPPPFPFPGFPPAPPLFDEDDDLYRQICGDRFLEPPEQCDDGNRTNGDGCSSDCLFEVCGNGVLNPTNLEQCDDGNRVSGDGCSKLCQYEVCGNGTIDPEEQCDTGGVTSPCCVNCIIMTPTCPTTALNGLSIKSTEDFSDKEEDSKGSENEDDSKRFN